MSNGTKEFESVYLQLKEQAGSSRCTEVGYLLKKLGFEVKNGKNGGHKIIFHDYLPNFTSSSYNCGHGKNPEIKKPYIKNILKILDLYKDDIINYIDSC